MAGLSGSVILDVLFNKCMMRPAALIPFWKLGANANAWAEELAPNKRACADLEI